MPVDHEILDALLDQVRNAALDFRGALSSRPALDGCAHLVDAAIGADVEGDLTELLGTSANPDGSPLGAVKLPVVFWHPGHPGRLSCDQCQGEHRDDRPRRARCAACGRRGAHVSRSSTFTLAVPVRVVHGRIAAFVAGAVTVDPVMWLGSCCSDKYSQNFVDLAAAFFLNPEPRAA